MKPALQILIGVPALMLVLAACAVPPQPRAGAAMISPSPADVSPQVTEAGPSQDLASPSAVTSANPDFSALPGRLYFFSSAQGDTGDSLHLVTKGQPTQSLMEGIPGNAPVLSPSGERVAVFSEFGEGRYYLKILTRNVSSAKNPESFAALVIEAPVPPGLRWTSVIDASGKTTDAGLLLTIADQADYWRAVQEIYRIADWRKPRLEKITAFNRNQRLPFRLSLPDWLPGTGAGRLVFTADLEHSDIFSMDLDSGTAQDMIPRALTRDNEDELRPKWSPDGKKILFESYRSGQYSFYTMNADGSELTHLLAPAGKAFQNLGDAVWSPDSLKVAFAAALGNSIFDLDLFTIDLARQRIRNLTRQDIWAQSVSSPVWSPDGRWLAFCSDNDIYVIREDGTGLMNVTASPDRLETMPVWMP